MRRSGVRIPCSPTHAQFQLASRFPMQRQGGPQRPEWDFERIGCKVQSSKTCPNAQTGFLFPQTHCTVIQPQRHRGFRRADGLIFQCCTTCSVLHGPGRSFSQSTRPRASVCLCLAFPTRHTNSRVQLAALFIRLRNEMAPCRLHAPSNAEAARALRIMLHG
jgi:hypothetical protein